MPSFLPAIVKLAGLLDSYSIEHSAVNKRYYVE
jgi:hypothetical protein